MKRLNPDTGKPFKHGHIRADGFIFWGYGNRLNKAGFFYETWVTPEKFADQRKRITNWQADNQPRIKAWRDTKGKASYRKHYYTHKKLRNDYSSNWKKLNRDKVNALANKRRAMQIQRTPHWLSREQLRDIADFYTIAQMFRMYTGEQYHVDHIVPLQGKKVSGLHVPWNLQVLPAIENIAKNNKHSIC